MFLPGAGEKELRSLSFNSAAVFFAVVLRFAGDIRGLRIEVATYAPKTMLVTTNSVFEGAGRGDWFRPLRLTLSPQMPGNGRNTANSTAEIDV